MPYALIMAGGVGQRLWPRSRMRTPKQTLAIGGDQPLLRQALERLVPEFRLEDIFVITTADQGDIVRQVLPDLPPDNVLLEPVGRNTAPCIGYGATVIRKRDPNATMVVLSADHVIRPVDAFRACLQAGCAAVEEDPKAVVCLGIVPTGVSSQLGHVRRGKHAGIYGGVPVFEAVKFIEKPPLPEAKRLTESGEVYWNSGIFVWKAQHILDELAANKPALAEGLARIEAVLGTPHDTAVIDREYRAFEKISIDYAVMEHAKRVLVVEGRFLWNDVGTWDSITQVYDPDAAGNVLIGRHVGIDTKGCVIACEPGQVIATIGVTDLVIVQTKDAVLVCPRSRAGEVRDLVDRLQAEGLDQHL